MPSAMRVAVAASGGRDSTALLHCTLRAARPLGIEVIALHVHHGLMPAADDWLAQVRAQARRWGAGFDCRVLAAQPGAGDSVEAWARRERYRALTEMACAAHCDLVLLAHHRADQAETWLLQALRGAGAAGLAAMPRSAQRDGITWARPWLALPRSAIDAYVQRHRLRHADDASNADQRFARSRLRTQVWPALTQAFADAEQTLCAAATRAQHAAALADETAALDLPALLEGDALRVAAWLALPPARRRNALRAWLTSKLSGGIPETLLLRLLAELPGARAARWPTPGGELRLYRGLLGALRDADGKTVLRPAAPVLPAATPLLDLSHAGDHRPPGWSGVFLVEAVAQAGADPALLRALAVRARSGGERLRLAPRAAARSLKQQFQARAVAPWLRDGPLLFTPQGQLLFVPGLGIDAALHAPAGSAQLGIAWLPDAAAAAERPDPHR